MKTFLKYLPLGVLLIVVVMYITAMAENVNLKGLQKQQELRQKEYEKQISSLDSIITESTLREAALMAIIHGVEEDINKSKTVRYNDYFNSPDLSYWLTLDEQSKADTISEFIYRILKGSDDLRSLLQSDTLRQPLIIPE